MVSTSWLGISPLFYWEKAKFIGTIPKEIIIKTKSLENVVFRIQLFLSNNK
jgi:hypothetical protein